MVTVLLTDGLMIMISRACQYSLNDLKCCKKDKNDQNDNISNYLGRTDGPTDGPT